jgi:hypothetical protein
MSNATNYLEQQIINTFLRGQATYVALATANPTDTGSNEVTTGDFPAYLRQAADGAGAAGSGWSDPGSTAGVTTNANKLTFPAYDGTADLTVTHFIVFTDSTGGNALVHAPLSASRTLRPGDRLIFDIGSLTVTVA